MRSILMPAVAWVLLSGCGSENGNSNLNDNSERPVAAIQVGFGDPFEAIEDGGEYLVSRGFQGLIDSLPTFRLLNFPPGTTARITMRLTLLDLARVILDETQELTFMEIAPGINELTSGLTIGESPGVAFGQRARLQLSVETVTGDPTSAAIEMNVVITEAK